MKEDKQNNFEPVANGLAEYGYAVVDHFLSKQEVNQVLQLDEFREGLLHFKKAGIGKNIDNQVNESIRGDYIKWIDKNSTSQPLQVFIGRLQKLMLFLNQSLFLSLKDFEAHLTIYPAGTRYQRHLDQFRADDHRKLSVVCYLNNDWKAGEGGQLRLHLPDGPRDLLPTAGRLVCFRSDQIEHEVLVASRGRFSLTGWLLDRDLTLPSP